ncbi:MAG: RcpC/CpaB family pilus assembly protein, partial [Acidimicrobiales bacterium]|nr:RcpC/CpaB family pilus assembly protein [Acidimicrobiales bacterium]
DQGLIETRQVSTATKPPDAVPSAASLNNQIFAVGVSEGDVITTAQLTPRSLSNVPIPEGFDGLAVSVEYTAGGAGYIAPGDTVNVYGVFGVPGSVSDGGLVTSSDGGPGAIPRTELALTNVLVLAVNEQQETAAQAAASAADGETGTRPDSNLPRTYLLALRPTDVERVVQLTSFANIYLSLTADDAPNVGDTPGVAGDSVNGPVSADSAAPQS